MTAEILRLADRRSQRAAAPADRPAMSAVILTLPVAGRAARPALASADAAALNFACRDLTTSLADIHRRAAALRERLAALDLGARPAVLSTDTIIETLCGVVAGRRDLSRSRAKKRAKESVRG
ncbi:MAG TPA: hypothetical protein VN668_06560 [Stellaceae bacterium]|nr:hypothetical protein [Stellaceae bacterium]